MGMFDRFRGQAHGDDPQQFDPAEDNDTRQMDQEAAGEQYEASEAPEQEPHTEEQERIDWKARAIEYQTRLELAQQQQQQYQQQQVEQEPDEVQVLEQRLQEARQNMPQIDPNDPQSFWKREQAKEEVDRLKDSLFEARQRRMEYSTMEQQSGFVVQSYKSQFQGSETFRAVEQRFDQLVSQLAPHLRQNPAMLDMVRKNVEYDYIQQQRGGKPVPPRAPGGEYNNQRPPKSKAVQFKSEQDQQVAEFYGMSPEEFYDPKNTEHHEVTNGNGVLVYDLPKPTGRRRYRG